MCRPPERRPARGPAGFTLVELLIALVLLGLVMSLVYTAFGQISGPAVRLRDQLTDQQELRLLTRMVADDLQSAQWLDQFWKRNTQGSLQYRTGIIGEPKFQGTKQYASVFFHAERPSRFYRGIDPADDPDLHEVAYYVQPSADRSNMVLMRREDFYVDDDIENGGGSVELADHIQSFDIQYLAPDADLAADPPPWQDAWDSTKQPDGKRMPLSIKLTITREGTGGRKLSESLEFNLPASLKLQ